MGRRLFYRIALIAGLLAIALIGGAIGFRVIEGYPWPDAFYMTLITITTVEHIVEVLASAECIGPSLQFTLDSVRRQRDVFSGWGQSPRR